MKETWKTIKGFENYQVSDFGRIISLKRIIMRKDNKPLTINGGILKPLKKYNGYCQVHLIHNKRSKDISIHRLVSLAFIPNPENKPQINHKNGIKDDNVLTNLEWCTSSENLKHAHISGLKKPSIGKDNGMYGIKGKDNVNSKPVIQLDINNNIINEFNSLTEASQKTLISRQYIGLVCNKQKKAGGYLWKYK